MGYHHDHDSPIDAAESLMDQEALGRYERRELLPLEVRRLLWEGATMMRPLDGDTVVVADRDAERIDLSLGERQVHRLLPDLEAPLLCVVPPGGDAGPMARRLLALGYRRVFTYAGSLLPR
jgi:hypothetical protein